jgi:hypothetical protein
VLLNLIATSAPAVTVATPELELLLAALPAVLTVLAVLTVPLPSAAHMKVGPLK